jgi:hypothetical protein
LSQLLRARSDHLQALQERAQQNCLAFSDEPLPPGASQPTGRVGIELDPHTERWLLHVERDITYSGPSEEVAAWFATGTLEFEGFHQLKDWISGPLAAAYAGHAASTSGSSRTASADPGQLNAILIDQTQLAASLAGEVVGQEHCIEQIVAATALHLARRSPRRPYTALALGPTGVGKTLLAESLATAIASASGEPCDYLRLDMTEFQERHSVSKLLGAPPGYIGFGDEPRLANTLRTGQRAVILIDEVEKAHSDVFLAIMNLMDAGRLTPASGPPVDARHAILIFTTNLGANVLAEALDRDAEVSDDPITRDTVVRNTLRSHGIAPELVGRLHTLLVFDALGDEHLDEVLRRTIAREAATFGLDVTTISASVLEGLRKRRPDPGSGVRAWEHLVSVDLGPVLLDACRRNLAGELAIVGDPPRIVTTSSR